MTAARVHPDHYVIGLTGNIATGKTTVAKMLEVLGAVRIDADRVAHWVMRPGTPAHTEIVEVFGEGILTAEGDIDRGALGGIVFSDPGALRRLEDIVHPATVAEVNRRIEQADAAVVVVEAIKLLEAGMARDCDSVWVTACPRGERIRRLVEGRGMSRAEAKRRVSAQPPQSEKVEQADVVIDTSGTLEWTREQVHAEWRNIPSP